MSTKLIANAPVMVRLLKVVDKVAQKERPILLRGETGTGKDVIARALHDASPRAKKPFLSVNCTALNEPLLESELFGHEKGSFTGATAQHAGLFEQADGGTLFLNEIGDISPALQAKLLQAVQWGTFRRVGGNQDKKVDVRLVAATHRSLLDMVFDGTFREDLYYRLSVFPIPVPALRERVVDIPEMATYFLSLQGEHYSLTDEAMEVLLQHDWPGNVRELQNVIERATIYADLEIVSLDGANVPIETHHIVFDVSSSPLVEIAGSTVIEPDVHELRFTVPLLPGLAAPELHERTVQAAERGLITFLLQAHNGNQSTVSRQMGITRGSLRNKMRSLGISLARRKVS